jgi:hypothetical protein
MSLTVISEIWNLVKPNIQTGDESETAELLVNYLIDNDYDPKDIKKTFKGDSNIIEAVSYFLEQPGAEFDRYDEEEEYYEDEDDYDRDPDEDEWD